MVIPSIIGWTRMGNTLSMSIAEIEHTTACETILSLTAWTGLYSTLNSLKLRTGMCNLGRSPYSFQLSPSEKFEPLLQDHIWPFSDLWTKLCIVRFPWKDVTLQSTNHALWSHQELPPWPSIFATTLNTCPWQPSGWVIMAYGSLAT